MRSQIDKLLKTLKTELVGICAFLALFFIVYIPNFLASTTHTLEVANSGPGNFTLTTKSSIRPGHYYLSLGRPKGSCTLKYGELVIATNKSAISSTRDGLGLSGLLEVNNNDKLTLFVTCEKESGFRPQLTYRPVLSNELFGKIVQFSRMIFQVYFGPTLAGALLIFILITLILNKPAIASTKFGYISLLIFSLLSFFYSLSLSHLTRLFLEAGSATTLHIFLRTSLSLSFLFLAQEISSKKYISTIVLAAWILVLLPISTDIGFLTPAYRYSFSLFIFSTVEIYVRNRKLFYDSPQKRLLVGFAFIWTLVQLADAIFSFGIENGENLSIVISLIAPLYIFYTVALRIRSLRESTILSNTITGLLAEDGRIEDRVNTFGFWLKQVFSAEHVSIYVDKFLLGLEETPGTHFRGVHFERNVPCPDFSVESLPYYENNNWSSIAIRQQSSLVGSIRQNRSAFVCIPVGPHLLFNLSFKQSSEKLTEAICEKLSFLDNNKSLLNSFAQIVSSHSSFHFETLRTLRSKLGDGERKGNLLSIFIDINGYSKAVKQYGNEFSTFIENVVFKKLSHEVRNLAVVELKMGDELHLVVLPWSLNEITIEDASKAVILNVLHFFRETLPQLCKAAGFNNLTVSGGIAYGDATLRINDKFVGTSGDSVNLAKRLLQGAEKGEFLFSNSAHELVSDLLPEAKAREVFIKNEHSMAVSVTYSSTDQATFRMVENF